MAATNVQYITTRHWSFSSSLWLPWMNFLAIHYEIHFTITQLASGFAHLYKLHFSRCFCILRFGFEIHIYIIWYFSWACTCILHAILVNGMSHQEKISFGTSSTHLTFDIDTTRNYLFISPTILFLFTAFIYPVRANMLSIICRYEQLIYIHHYNFMMA